LRRRVEKVLGGNSGGYTTCRRSGQDIYINALVRRCGLVVLAQGIDYFVKNAGFKTSK
jgi:hypothetical protein